MPGYLCLSICFQLMVPKNGARRQFCMRKICLIVKIAWKNRTRIPSATTGTVENMTVFSGYFYDITVTTTGVKELGAGDFSWLLWTFVPGYFYREIEAKEFLSCLIPQLLVVITWKLEMLVTARTTVKPVLGSHSWGNGRFQKISIPYHGRL